ncbi:PEP-CTERM sorting domain-containing protein [Parvularcula sp. ZS-1/3]|uniref:PEP-CTERM sorting domain-containing protein n=1 Tax=Parvularcula mediterranea TaxID=2732508 RepID=A0A7Y3RLZ6_9PROT|nr:VPLPA-CTERM sorting domain-containing protein [Parvularcula mediterranea]NNU16561.1 PEP-CTERM sorting domain-containing protein [Parvularcula mediterranea]
MKHLIAGLCAAAAVTGAASAATFTVTVDGTDAIFLAGRIDLAIPPANQPWGDKNAATDDGLRRHSGATPEEALETLPPFLTVMAGDVVRVLDPAVGGVNFFNGNAGGLFGPEGNGGAGSSNITSLGGISGYTGTQGALTGVFLSDAVPNGAPPATLPFDVNAVNIAPQLGQIFYIGDGQTPGGEFRTFTAPPGATRVFFGIPDAFGFGGVPGAYDDNDGSYRVRVGINEIPEVPLPAAPLLFLSGLAGVGFLRRKKR